MFTNYKIFLDNNTDEIDIKKIETKLDTLCKASIDTAAFTQSISSTSINKKSEDKIEDKIEGSFSLEDAFKDTSTSRENQEYGFAKGGKRKFNMNQLLEHKNKKPRTHRNLSTKNKKSKVFYNRTKKNT